MCPPEKVLAGVAQELPYSRTGAKRLGGQAAIIVLCSPGKGVQTAG
jgi:hypothetical protein